MCLVEGTGRGQVGNWGSIAKDPREKWQASALELSFMFFSMERGQGDFLVRMRFATARDLQVKKAFSVFSWRLSLT